MSNYRLRYICFLDGSPEPPYLARRPFTQRKEQEKMAEDVPDDYQFTAADIALAVSFTMAQLIRSLDPETRKRLALNLAHRLEVSELDPLIPSSGHTLTPAHKYIEIFVEAANS